MKTHVWAFGAASDKWVAEGEKLYIKRIERYIPFEYKNIQVTKSNQPLRVLDSESKWLQTQITQSPGKVILLDETGSQYSSQDFSKKLESWRQGTHKRLIFIIGSAYGYDQRTRAMADDLLSLSTMTLPHQLCRLLFLEQIYRACTILRGEAYHH